MWEYEAEFVVSAFVGGKGIPKSGDLCSIDKINVHTEANTIIGAQFEAAGLGAEAKRDSTFWQLSCVKSG